MIEDKYLNARFEQIENSIAQLAQNLEIIREVIEHLGEGDINSLLKEARGVEEVNEEEPEEEEESDETEENGRQKRSRPKALQE